MATQTRVPGAASSEVDFELERFERTAEDRIEISGRWYGLRGRRFVRPVLNLESGGSRRRAIALLEHKPWAAEDGQVWLAAFRWPEGAGEVTGAELEVGPGLLVDLPALGGKAGAASVRVTALRPQIPALPPWRAGEDGAEHAPYEPGPAEAAGSAPPPAARRPGVAGGRDTSHRRTAGTSARAAVPAWTDAPHREAEFEVPPRPATPPRDVVAAIKAERDEAITARDAAERERVTALQDRDDALSRRDAALRDVDRAVTERESAVAERDRLTAELERITRERDHAHAERNRMMQDSEAVQRERDQAAAERDAARSELSRALPAREQAIRERDAEAARAEQAERERDTALAERKSAVAQRDRARRERDRAMRAAGLEPPDESPYVSLAREERAAPPSREAAPPPRRAAAAASDPAATAAFDAAGAAVSDPAAAAASDPAGAAPFDPAGAAPFDPAAAAAPPDAAGAVASDRSEAAAGDGAPSAPPDGAAAAGSAASDAAGAAARRNVSAASPPGTPLPSRPIKRIGAGPLGPAPEPKPLLTPVDSGRPRRLSRTRRPPSTTARWAVRITVILLMLAIAVVLLMLIGRAL